MDAWVTGGKTYRAALKATASNGEGNCGGDEKPSEFPRAS